LLDFSKDEGVKREDAMSALSSVNRPQYGLFQTRYVLYHQKQFSEYRVILMQLMQAKKILDMDAMTLILKFLLGRVSKSMVQLMKTRILSKTRPEQVSSELLKLTLDMVSERIKKAEQTQSVRMDLSRCGLNRIDNIEMFQTFFKGISEKTTQLSLRGNGLGTDKSKLAFTAEMFKAIPKTITYVDFSDNGLQDSDGEQLRKWFVHLPSTVIWITIDQEKPLSLKSQIACRQWPHYFSSVASGMSDVLLQARTLLNDYTKGDSAFWRFICLHWNRHHTAEVARWVTYMDKGLLTNIQDVLGELERLEKVNETGCLAKRTSFLASQSFLADRARWSRVPQSSLSNEDKTPVILQKV
jgi:hypothetical protein